MDRRDTGSSELSRFTVGQRAEERKANLHSHARRSSGDTQPQIPSETQHTDARTTHLSTAGAISASRLRSVIAPSVAAGGRRFEQPRAPGWLAARRHPLVTHTSSDRNAVCTCHHHPDRLASDN